MRLDFWGEVRAGFAENDRRDGCFEEAEGMRRKSVLPRVSVRVNHGSFRNDVRVFSGVSLMAFCFAVGRPYDSFP